MISLLASVTASAIPWSACWRSSWIVVLISWNLSASSMARRTSSLCSRVLSGETARVSRAFVSSPRAWLMEELSAGLPNSSCMRSNELVWTLSAFRLLISRRRLLSSPSSIWRVRAESWTPLPAPSMTRLSVLMIFREYPSELTLAMLLATAFRADWLTSRPLWAVRSASVREPVMAIFYRDWSTDMARLRGAAPLLGVPTAPFAE